MDPPPPSAAQQRFMAAQHLMATRVRQPQWRPQTQTQTQPPSEQLHSATRSSGANDHRKRRRPPLPSKETAFPPPQWLLQASNSSAEMPRKSTQSGHKEHRDALAHEVHQLEQCVERLRLRAGLPTQTDRQRIAETKCLNAEMEHAVYESTRFQVQLLARTSQQLQSPPLEPLSTYIHMPCDQAKRRAILRGMKGVKLRRAAEVAIERFRHLDANASYLLEERFTTKDGTFHCNRWEINAFPQFTSAHQLYDALLFWLYNLEISATEMVEHVAVREDNEEIEPTIWNHRIIVQADDVGCIEELNMVAFAHFYESCDLMDGVAVGVIAMDTVDVDDLYPYKPMERTRKDVQSSFLIHEVVDPVSQKTVVVVKACNLIAQLAPQFPVEPRVIQKLHEYMSCWPAAIVQHLHDYAVPT